MLFRKYWKEKGFNRYRDVRVARRKQERKEAKARKRAKVA